MNITSIDNRQLLRKTKQNTLPSFEDREAAILDRIKKHHGSLLQRNVDDVEAKEIATNLLGFAKAIYGIK